MSDTAEHRQFMKLVDAHGAQILSLLRRLCRNASDADDVFQETAIRVWRFRANRPRLRSPRAWLMTIAYRTFLDSRKKSKADPMEQLDVTDHRHPGPVQVAEAKETKSKLMATVHALPQAQREIVVLHYSGGLTLRQTAQAMGISLGTVKSRLAAALVQLRSDLDEMR